MWAQSNIKSRRDWQNYGINCELVFFVKVNGIIWHTLKSTVVGLLAKQPWCWKSQLIQAKQTATVGLLLYLHAYAVTACADRCASENSFYRCCNLCFSTFMKFIFTFTNGYCKLQIKSSIKRHIMICRTAYYCHSTTYSNLYRSFQSIGNLSRARISENAAYHLRKFLQFHSNWRTVQGHSGQAWITWQQVTISRKQAGDSYFEPLIGSHIWAIE